MRTLHVVYCMKSDNQKYHFAVFGDIHGRVALMYTLAFLWENESGIKLSGILQVGDMGAFPNPLKVFKNRQT